MENLPLLVIGDTTHHASCDAAAREHPEGTTVGMLRFDTYWQVRMDVDAQALEPLKALDDFLELADRHDLITHWRDHLLRLA